MQLRINKKEYIEVSFWSFTKWVFLSQLALTGICWGVFAIIGIALALFGV